MADAAVAADVDEALYVCGNDAPEVSLHAQIPLDIFAEPGYLVLGHVANAGIGPDSCFPEYVGARRPPDAEYVRQGGFESLISGQIDSCYPCHRTLSLGGAESALHLLVLGLVADHTNFSVASYDLAAVAHLLDR